MGKGFQGCKTGCGLRGMKKVIRFSAGLLNEFRLTMEEKFGKDQDSFLAYLTLPFVESPAVLAGKAFHRIVEKGGINLLHQNNLFDVPDGSGGTVSMPSATVRRALDLHAEYRTLYALHEQWRGGVIQDLGGVVIATLGKQDVRVLTRIEDIKTTARPKNQDDLYDDLQWQLYLMTDQAAQAFRYRMFVWDDLLNITEEQEFTFTRADLREDYVVDYCQQLYHFMDLHGYLDKYVLPEDKYFTVGL